MMEVGLMSVYRQEMLDAIERGKMLGKKERVLQEKEQKLERFIKAAIDAKKMPVTVQRVLDDLMSVEDEQDIVNNAISLESVTAHIDAWLAMGAPYQSGKPKAKA